MLLEDFNKPIIKEAVDVDNIERLLNLSDTRNEPNAPPTSYNSLVKAEPNWRAAECMGIESIPQRYFLGYTGDALDQTIQKFFFIGFDTRGNLDQPGNYHIWIGAKYQSAEFESARRAFYDIVYPDQTQINPETKNLEFVNFPVERRANTTNLRKWVNQNPKTPIGTTGSWYRLVPDGNLIRIDATEDSLTYKKLMNFSGFDEQGNRTAEFLVKHRAENVQRTIDEILKDQDDAKPLKDGDKAKLPGFKGPDGKDIIFEYKQVKDSNGEVLEGYWLNPANGKKIDRGSPEHELLMAIKGKEPDGKTNLRPAKKSIITKLLSQGRFKLSTYTNKGLRFQNDPKLNAMGKLFGVIGDTIGSWLKKPIQDFFDKSRGNRHDPDGKLFDVKNPDSFINQMKSWRNQKDGLQEMKRFLEKLAEEFEQEYGQKPDLLKNYDKGFKFAPYGDNIYRLIREVDDFVTPKFREGDVVGYVSRDGKPKKVVIIEMNPVNPAEVVVQDMEYYRTKGLKPQGPAGILIDKDGRQIRNKIFDPDKLFPRQESYRKKFEQAHPNVNLIKFLELVGYNMPYHFKQSTTPIRATTVDLAKMKQVYKELAGKDWEDKRRIKNPDNPEEEIYDTGPGTRHNVLNRFGIIVVNYTKLIDLDKLQKLLDEFKNRADQDNQDDGPQFVPQQHKVGDVVLFIGGTNTSKQGKPIPAKIVGLKRNVEAKPGTPVPKDGTCWVKTKDNNQNGFELTTANIMTYDQWRELRAQGKIDEFEEWAAEPFDREDPNDPESPNFGNV